MIGISIIVANFNSGTHLAEAVRSVLALRLHIPHEIIIADDGSTDFETKRTLQKIKDKKNPNIHVLELAQNQGQSAARNHALARAAYDFILPLDSDDMLDTGATDFINDSLQLLTQNNNIFTVYARAQLCGAKTGPYILPPFSNARLPLGNMIPVFGIYRASDAKDIGGYREDMRYCEDWELWLALASKHYEDNRKPIAIELLHNASLYRQHEHGGNVSIQRRTNLTQLFAQVTQRAEPLYETECGTTDPETLVHLRKSNISRLGDVFDIVRRYGFANAASYAYDRIEGQLAKRIISSYETLERKLS